MNNRPNRLRSRKRQLAGPLLVIFVSYPLSLGPWDYAIGRGWVPMWAKRASWWYFQPAAKVFNLIPTGDGYTVGYHWMGWGLKCGEYGERDREAR
jgi:hypothetical protein